MLAFDLRDAIRGLARDRLYSAVAVLTLALTLGATTAVFSIIDGVLLRPLAYPEADRLVSVREAWRPFFASVEVNERHFEYWRTHARSFESLAQYIRLPANMTGAGDAAQITVVHSSGSIFDVLRVRPALGRLLVPDDDRDDRPDVVVITDALWRERFGANRSIVGRQMTLDGRPYAVVGVLPADFRLPVPGQVTTKLDAFVTIRLAADRVGWVGDHNNEAIGRLRGGVTVEQARAELDVLQRQVSTIATQEAHEPVALSSVVRPLAETVVGTARRGLLLLFAAIGAVLLIACANLANLSLTRTTGRWREVAIRSALGAGRSRLVARGVLEQMVLATVGGVLGLWVAWGALVLFVRTAPIDLPRVDDVALDLRVVAFAAAVSVLAGLVVAVLPAWRITHTDVEATLRAGSGTLAGDRQGTRTRGVLVAVQVGLSVTLLVVTALLTTSFTRLLNVDRGFSADRVLAVPVALPAERYAERAVRLAAYDRILTGIHALPGVKTATSTSMLPLGGQGQVNFIAPDGNTRPRSELPAANFRFVAPEFFTTLTIHVVRGRPFRENEQHDDRPAPAVISESTAQRLWPGQNPIGKRFSRGLSDEQGFEVVGVVTDARTTSLDRTPPLMVYVPYWWGSPAASRTSMSFLIRTANDPAAAMQGVRRIIQQVDPEIAVGPPRLLDDIVETSMAGRRYQVRLFVSFGAVALLIATLGVYAVTSYAVARRRREMNVRVALGANAIDVLRLIVRQGALPIGIGVVAGAAGAAAAATVVATLLFEVNARDPLIITVVSATVGVVGIAATVMAAKQGLVLNPAAALREE